MLTESRGNFFVGSLFFIADTVSTNCTRLPQVRELLFKFEVSDAYIYNFCFKSGSTDKKPCKQLHSVLPSSPKRYKILECWPNTTSAWGSWGDFIFQWIGVIEDIPCYSSLGSLTCH